MNLFFDSVRVINLDRRPDRMEIFEANLDKFGWDYKRPVRVRAIDGDVVHCPGYFQQGNGAWGCRQSHARILEDYLLDTPHDKALLVLEDDAYLRPNSLELLSTFLKDVPPDWDCLMLGGQHHGPTPMVKPGVVKCNNAQRTHAYAVRGNYARVLYHLWSNSKVHIDWEVVKVQSAHNVYAPSEFVFGQEAGTSDISGRDNPRKAWSGSSANDIIVVLNAPKKVMAELRGTSGFWGGGWRDPITDLDNGLREIFELDSEPAIIERLRKWINVVGDEVDTDGTLCLHHPSATGDLVRQATNRTVIHIVAKTTAEAMTKFANRGE